MKKATPLILCSLSVLFLAAAACAASKRPPYVGVTGFTCRHQVEATLEAIPENPSSHKLMMGIQVTDRTLSGELNRKPARTPEKKALGSIYVADERALNFIHYSTRYPESLAEQLEEVTKLVGPNLHGIQVNLMRPPIEQIRMYREKHPEMLLVFQIQPGLLKAHGDDLTRVIEEELRDYSEVFDYMTFDLSRGWGIPLDQEQAFAAARELTAAFPDHGIGVAGGLSAETLYKIEAMAGSLPNLTIDAETGMRCGDACDVLHQGNVDAYTAKAFKIFE